MIFEGKTIHFYGNKNSKNIFIQPIDEHDFSLMDKEINEIRKRVKNDDMLIVTLLIEKWNEELTPWKADPVFGKEGFGDKATITLSFITIKLLPYLNTINSLNKNYYLIGYSLAGFFAIWSAYQTDVFNGVGGVSPSLWYDGWIEYARKNNVKCENVYLSLGDKEEKAKNPTMAKVGDCIREQFDLLNNNSNCILEWNTGNHFMDSDVRVAKAVSWLVEQSNLS